MKKTGGYVMSFHCSYFILTLCRKVLFGFQDQFIMIQLYFLAVVTVSTLVLGSFPMLLLSNATPLKVE